MAAPDFIAQASARHAGSASASVVIPSTGPGGSVATGMKAILTLTLTPGAPTSDPAGFTDVGDTFDQSTNSGGRMYIWEADITAAGSVDPGDTVTIPLSGSSRWALAIDIYEACDVGTGAALGKYAPVPGSAGNTDGTLTSPGATAPDDSRAVHIYGVNSNLAGEQPTWTAHGSTTERTDVTSDHGSSRNATILVADEVVAPGAVPGRTATSTFRVQPSAFTLILTVAVDRPIATCAADINVAGGQPFTLGVTPSGGSGAPYTYQWTQTGGTTTALDNATLQAPAGTAGSQTETLTYQCVVTDDTAVDSLPDTQLVNVLGASDTAVPVANVTVTGWATEPGADDEYEVLADILDSTYAYYEDPVGSVVLEVELSALNDPDGDEPYTVSYRASQVAGTDADVTVILKQGASTVIASWTDSWGTADTVQQFDHQLTAGQVASITDFTDLRLRFEATLS